MENMPIVLSLLFFLGTFASLYWGFSGISYKIKSELKIVYLLVCIALAIWSFGFGMSNLVNIDYAVYWRRFASLGMTSLFSLVLHLVILLTSQKKQSFIKKYIFLIHIPALLSMFFFVFYSKSTMILYDLVKLDLGLTNIAETSFLNYFYYFYFLSYMGLSLLLLMRWGKNLKNKDKKRQSVIIIISIISVLITSTITDIIFPTFLEYMLPQMAPLFILIPIWALYYSVIYHGILSEEETISQEIITKKQEKLVFEVFSIGIILSGFLSILFEYFSNESSNSGYLLGSFSKGIILIGIGILLFLFQRIKSDFYKQKFTTIILIISVPVVSFLFLEYSSITVWVYSIVIMVSALLFNNRTLFNSVTIIAFITQVVIWILKPEVLVLVDMYDYILRIILIGVTFLLGTYLNRIYTNKIKENNYQIAFQKLVSDITLELVGFNKNNSYEKLNNFLNNLGDFFKADRVYIFTINNKDKTMTYSHEWCNVGVNNQVDRLEGVPLDAFSWWIEKLYKDKHVLIHSVKDMPFKARTEQEELLEQGVKSLVSVPIIIQDEMLGFIGMDLVTNERSWTK